MFNISIGCQRLRARGKRVAQPTSHVNRTLADGVLIPNMRAYVMAYSLSQYTLSCPVPYHSQLSIFGTVKDAPNTKPSLSGHLLHHRYAYSSPTPTRSPPDTKISQLLLSPSHFFSQDMSCSNEQSKACKMQSSHGYHRHHLLSMSKHHSPTQYSPLECSVVASGAKGGSPIRSS